MTKVNEVDPQGQETRDVKGEIEILENLDGNSIIKSLGSIGLSEELIDKALLAAMKVFEDAGAKNVFISEFMIEEEPNDFSEKCGCGSRCVARQSVPYRRCWTENGRRICVTGHRRVCTRRACNPC